MDAPTPRRHSLVLTFKSFQINSLQFVDRSSCLRTEEIDNLANILKLSDYIDIADIGAAYINQKPIYEDLVMKSSMTNLHLFDGDKRQILALKNRYGEKAHIYDVFLGDGEEHKLYVCEPASGMTSLLKPNERALNFFNGFNKFGSVLHTESVATTKLDDLSDIRNIDFLKLDIQGSEKNVIEHGLRKLDNCVAIQLEVSFIPLYENQPTIGEVDTFMREIGFVPHGFTELKRWSIAPTVRDNNFRKPFNQLLEADMLYIRNPFNSALDNERRLKTLAFLSHCLFGSPDLTVHAMLRLVDKGAIENGAVENYFKIFSAP